MKVLVTGATGFIGSHLVPRLTEAGYDVLALGRYATSRDSLGSPRQAKTVFTDLRDASAVRGALREIRPDAVVHIASISPVAYSYDHPQEVTEANFLATVNLAEACLREVPHFGHFLFASTSETYGNGPNPKTEDTVQHPNSPYAVSKFAAEKYLLYMRDAHQFPVTILRPFNSYGRKNDTHFVVERAVAQMLRGSDVLLGDPTPVRDLMYVDDHVRAYLTCLGQRAAVGRIFNFCTGRAVSIAELVQLISEQTGFQGNVLWNSIPRRPLDIDVLIGDYSRARTELGWTPEVSLEEGLRQTIDFWRASLLRGK